MTVRKAGPFASGALVGALLMVLVTGAARAAADTAQLPRTAGSKDVYASPATTIYASPAGVADTAAAVAKALTAAGWKGYSIANSSSAPASETQQILYFKKGSEAINALITRPDNSTTAMVNYIALPLRHDLPFPAAGRDFAFDANQPFLAFASSESVSAAMAESTSDLGALGWAPAPGVVPSGDDKAARAFFVRAGEQPMLLTATRAADGATRVEISAVPEAVLAAARPTPKASATPAAKPPAAAPEPVESADDNLGDSIAKQANKMADDALADALKDLNAPKAPAKSTPAAATETLTAREDGEAPIPTPDNAEGLDYDGASGSLEFESPSSVASVAKFYRENLKRDGWTSRPSVIDKPNMVELEFAKAGKSVSMTVMKMGAKTQVEAHGEGLVSAQTGAAEPAAEPTPAPTASADDLQVEESGGLPMPKAHSSSGSDSTPFRHALNAQTSLDLATVLTFYRGELSKRGWTEQPGAEVKADTAKVAFSSPDGPAVLTLSRSGSETAVALQVRDTVKAQKSGLLPKPGQVKALFGNMMGVEAVFTIGKKSVKVPAGAGSKGPDGPTLELAPGKYKVQMKVAGKPAVTEDIEVGGDEIWGLLAGPGGMLPMQMY